VPLKWRATRDGDEPPQDQAETEGHALKIRPVTDDQQDDPDAEGHGIKVRPVADEQTPEK